MYHTGREAGTPVVGHVGGFRLKCDLRSLRYRSRRTQGVTLVGRLDTSVVEGAWKQ